MWVNTGEEVGMSLVVVSESNGIRVGFCCLICSEL